MRPIIQVNLQTEFGGGEVYTRFLTESLLALGVDTKIIIHQKAAFWQKFNLPEHCFIKINDLNELPGILNKHQGIVLSHGPLPLAITQQLKNRFLVAIAHMPLTGRNPEPFRPYQRIIAVSQYVLKTLKEAGLNQSVNMPLYGIANTNILQNNAQPIIKTSHYNWDKRKGRDVLLSYLEPLYSKFLNKAVYQKKPGITLGIISRITPIKQFPLMFEILSPIIKQFPQVNLEIFGSGGYASISDCKAALKPIKKQVRFWGQQWNVGQIYRQMDYVLSGLPEKEALGLNLIEAQTCGTPVIAVNAPPFIETINPNVSGYLYQDPRIDQGEDFKRVMKLITASPAPKLQPKNSSHLLQFTMDSFGKTLQDILEELNKDTHETH